MILLLCHLLGDYVLQTDYMAKNKRASWFVAYEHALFYTLPFTLVTKSLWALLVILVTHCVIDHLGLAAYVVRWKNQLGSWKDRAIYETPTGYPADAPPWLAVWLVIIVDNTMHLLINYFAVKYL